MQFLYETEHLPFVRFRFLNRKYLVYKKDLVYPFSTKQFNTFRSFLPNFLFTIVENSFYFTKICKKSVIVVRIDFVTDMLFTMSYKIITCSNKSA